MGKRKMAPAPVVTKEEYDAATPAERRVMLAREVLSLVDAGVVTAASHYSDADTWNTRLTTFLAYPKCEVCARGALVIALARVANECSSRGIESPSDLGRLAALHIGPEDAFPERDTWEEIEIAFEAYDDGEYPAATAWGEEHEHLPATDRLRALCNALIASDGSLFSSSSAHTG